MQIGKLLCNANFYLLKYWQLQQMHKGASELELESGILFEPMNFLPIIAGEV